MVATKMSELDAGVISDAEAGPAVRVENANRNEPATLSNLFTSQSYFG